ncbi:MAG: integrin alpha [Gammaproteobacteria bacterium]
MSAPAPAGAKPGARAAHGARFVDAGSVQPGHPAFGQTLDLSSLAGTLGFRIDGATLNQTSGRAVAGLGDVNGDGLADILIGAPGDNTNGTYSGAAYVIFGRSPPVANGILKLSALSGGNGFKLAGTPAQAQAGRAVAGLGDVNGDGLADFLIGAPGVSNGNNPYAGAAFVVFGRTGTVGGGVLQLSALNGSNGFRLSGINSSDFTGYAVSGLGDVNGDGLADLLVGAPTPPPPNSRPGMAFVVFGRRTAFPGGVLQLSALNGTNGFRLDGEGADDRAGFAVGGLGDVNGDGLADILVGALRADPNGGAGAAYVVFGRRAAISGGVLPLSTLNGTNGFRLNGAAANDRAGISVSGLGDVNGDGVDDLVVGAHRADANGADSGTAYVVFGRNGLGAGGVLQLSALAGANGFRLKGASAYDFAGYTVSGLGDVNGDGMDDLLVGAPGRINRNYAGSAYVVFGRNGLGAGGCWSCPASMARTVFGPTA